MFSRPKRKVLAIYLGFIIASLRNILAIIRAALVAIISSKHYDENDPSIRGRHKDRQYESAAVNLDSCDVFQVPMAPPEILRLLKLASYIYIILSNIKMVRICFALLPR